MAFAAPLAVPIAEEAVVLVGAAIVVMAPVIKHAAESLSKGLSAMMDGIKEKLSKSESKASESCPEEAPPEEPKGPEDDKPEQPEKPAKASDLRKWAQDQGYVKRPGTGTPEGGPETWEDPETGEWKLKLKEARTRPELEEGSKRPTYSAKDSSGRYYDPISGKSGARSELGHLPLEFD